MTAEQAAGRLAEIRIRGRVEHDAYGYHITDPQGRRWNLQHDDPVTLAHALEVAR